MKTMPTEAGTFAPARLTAYIGPRFEHAHSQRLSESWMVGTMSGMILVNTAIFRQDRRLYAAGNWTDVLSVHRPSTTGKLLIEALEVAMSDIGRRDLSDFVTHESFAEQFPLLSREHPGFEEAVQAVADKLGIQRSYLPATPRIQRT